MPVWNSQVSSILALVLPLASAMASEKMWLGRLTWMRTLVSLTRLFLPETGSIEMMLVSPIFVQTRFLKRQTTWHLRMLLHLALSYVAWC